MTSNNRALYISSIADFIQRDASTILGYLVNAYHGSIQTRHGRRKSNYCSRCFCRGNTRMPIFCSNTTFRGWVSALTSCCCFAVWCSVWNSRSDRLRRFRAMSSRCWIMRSISNVFIYTARTSRLCRFLSRQIIRKSHRTSRIHLMTIKFITR